MNPQQATENYFLLMCEYGNVDIIQAMVSSLNCVPSSSNSDLSSSSNLPSSSSNFDLVISQRVIQQGCSVSLSRGHVSVAQKICQLVNICPDLSFIPTHIAVEMTLYCNADIYNYMHLFTDGTIEAMSSIEINKSQVERFWPNVLAYLSTIAVSGPQWLKEWHIEILLQEYKQTHNRNIQYLVGNHKLPLF